VVLSVAVAVATAAVQRTIGSSRWDWTVRDYEGVFLAEPSPLLLEIGSEGRAGRLHHLVREAKYGFTREEAAPFHLARVSLRATRLGDGETTMLEVVSGSLRRVPAGSSGAGPVPPRPVPAGPCVLRGEIVDSKCYLGAMNPGLGKPHRACAIHCLRGGIPPVLLARDAAGATALFLLVGPGGAPIHQAVLDVVAEPVEVPGSLSYLGPLAVLETDPANIRRLPSAGP
jgi:hypothetical protein